MVCRKQCSVSWTTKVREDSCNTFFVEKPDEPGGPGNGTQLCCGGRVNGWEQNGALCLAQKSVCLVKGLMVDVSIGEHLVLILRVCKFSVARVCIMLANYRMFVGCQIDAVCFNGR